MSITFNPASSASERTRAAVSTDAFSKPISAAAEAERADFHIRLAKLSHFHLIDP